LQMPGENTSNFPVGREPAAAIPAARRLLCLFLVLLSGSAGFALPARGQADAATGYEVKAAFLFNFAKFIEWSPAAFATPQSPFVICVLGPDPFGNVLDDTLQGKTIGDRVFTVQRIKDGPDARHCQMVFVSSSESAHLIEIVESTRGAHVLLAGETAGFAASGGTIEFTLEDNHVHFTINTDAANRSGLKFSSKLLALAKIVHDQARPKEE
jgi:YfiR/HmsC-like